MASPFDAWTNASINLTRNDFELLYKSAIEILSEINPAFQLVSEQRHMASMFGKTREFSAWIREGVIQSLILTSIFGDKLKFDLPLNAEIWVDRIVAELLSTDSSEMWKSFEGKLPLIAEAAPTSFLNAVERHLTNTESPISSLFEEDPGFITAHSYHTGLLWALESLAWFPKFLSRAALILTKLSVIDPGGSLSNRPINSLFQIFKSWRCQTLASFDERMDVLKLISEREPEIAWTILISMLPDSTGGVAFPTHKTRWRMFELDTERPITYKEIYDTHSAVVELLIATFDFTESKLAKIIKESVNLSLYDRDKILSFVEKVLSAVKQIEFAAWHACRKILSQHRSHPDARWALPEDQLARFEKLYEILMPKDEIDKAIWMFNDHWPNFAEGFKYESGSHEMQEKFILEKRIKGLTDIHQNYGIEKIIELSATVKEPWILGDTLGYIVNAEEEIIKLCELLKKEKPGLRFIQSFIFRKSFLINLEWVFDLFEKLKGLGFSNSSLAELLIPLVQTHKLWGFIESAGEEVMSEYWRNIYPRFYGITLEEKLYGLQKLVEHKRFLSAIHSCSHFVEEIPSEVIVIVLQRAGEEKAEEQIRLDGYEVNRLFETIDSRNDVHPNILIHLEWLFLPVLASYGNNRKPKRLHEELSRDPVFFMDVLKWVYKPDDEAKVEEHKVGLTDEQIQNRAEQSFKLLQSWESIPGVDNAGNVDFSFLSTWVDNLRDLAVEFGRVEIADAYIGGVLAHYPEEQNKIWPPDEICSLIESINSDSIKRSFSSAIFNKRGSSTRGSFDGGNIERDHSAYFHKHAESHRNKFPAITTIFETLAKSYEADAKMMDDEAERRKLEY